MRISAIVPAYSETASLAAVVIGLHERIGDWLDEVLIVLAPPAPSETRRICAELSNWYPTIRVVEQSRFPGLGWAVRQGIAEAKGSHILMIDSDGEMDVATVPLLVDAVRGANADMVVASRWMPGGGVEGYSPVKYVLNRCFQWVVRLLYRTRLHDLTLGFKLARADLLKQIAWRGTYHEVACETTLRVVRLGYRVVEVPTVWRRRTEGASANPFRRNFRYVVLAVAVLLERRPAVR